MTWSKFNDVLFCDRKHNERYYYVLNSKQELNIILNITKIIFSSEISSALASGIQKNSNIYYIHMGDYCLGGHYNQNGEEYIRQRYKNMKKLSFRDFIKKIKYQDWPELKELSIKNWVDNKYFTGL